MLTGHILDYWNATNAVGHIYPTVDFHFAITKSHVDLFHSFPENKSSPYVPTKNIKSHCFGELCSRCSSHTAVTVVVKVIGITMAVLAA